MKTKNLFYLGEKEQDLINEFTKLIGDICIQVGDDECVDSCYFTSLCPHCVDVMDSFCNLWNEREDIEVQKGE